QRGTTPAQPPPKSDLERPTLSLFAPSGHAALQGNSLKSLIFQQFSGLQAAHARCAICCDRSIARQFVEPSAELAQRDEPAVIDGIEGVLGWLAHIEQK